QDGQEDAAPTVVETLNPVVFEILVIARADVVLAGFHPLQGQVSVTGPTAEGLDLIEGKIVKVIE
ncbi:MAG: hypothetical protein P8X98_09740, partial [Woeseiaceae bacterium]